MSRMNEPLKPEPPCAEPATNEAIQYTEGFYDGASALAHELLDLHRLGDGDEVMEALERFERGDARPCAGWTNEPKRN